MNGMIKKILSAVFLGFLGMTFLQYFLNYRALPFRQVMFDCMKNAVPGALIFAAIYFFLLNKKTSKKDDGLKSGELKKSFCSKCGANVSANDTFCSECGHSLK